MAGDPLTIGQRHIGVEHAVIRLINTELALNGWRSKTDFTPYQTPPCAQPVAGVDFLDCVSRHNIIISKLLPHGSNRHASLMRVSQRSGDILNRPRLREFCRHQ